MKNTIKMFENSEFGSLTTIVRDNGEFYFIAKEISEFLGYKLTGDMNKRLDDDEKTNIPFRDSGSNYQTNKIVINESGLYNAIIGSKKPEAKAFKKWITSEVLPSIRKINNSIKSISYCENPNGLVMMREGFCYTTTNMIANTFNKRHRKILEIIDGYIEKNIDEPEIGLISSNTSDFMKQHCIETTYIDSMNRPQKSYELDEFAFSFIALSFTGEKSEEFKIKFINQFFVMRQALINRTKALAIEQILPQKPNLRQYVYLIKNESSNNIKIGIGQNPEQRLKQLQTGADGDLTLLYKSMVCSNAYEIETYLHHTFSDCNIRGEWFDVSEEDILNVVSECEFVLNTNIDDIDVIKKFSKDKIKAEDDTVIANAIFPL